MWEGLSVNRFLKHSNYFKLTLKMIYNGTVRVLAMSRSRNRPCIVVKKTS